jgi:hypothetical protein
LGWLKKPFEAFASKGFLFEVKTESYSPSKSPDSPSKSPQRGDLRAELVSIAEQLIRLSYCVSIIRLVFLCRSPSGRWGQTSIINQQSTISKSYIVNLFNLSTLPEICFLHEKCAFGKESGPNAVMFPAFAL